MTFIRVSQFCSSGRHIFIYLAILSIMWCLIVRKIVFVYLSRAKYCFLSVSDQALFTEQVAVGTLRHLLKGKLSIAAATLDQLAVLHNHVYVFYLHFYGIIFFRITDGVKIMVLNGINEWINLVSTQFKMYSSSELLYRDLGNS